MKIQLASSENIDAWMALVEQVRDAFPGLETAEAWWNTEPLFCNSSKSLPPSVHWRQDGRGCPAVLKGKQRAVLSGGGPRP